MAITASAPTTPTSPLQTLAQTAQDRNERLADDIQDRFLTMLITQLQNQDPLNPMDNAEITSQMAQLSTVNGIQQLNQTLLALSGQIDMSQSLQAAGLIGKDVLVPGEKILLGSSPDGEGKVAAPFGMDLLSPAASTEVTIFDASGAPVRRMDLGPLPVGVHPLVWDGTDDAGATVPDGSYRLEIQAKDEEGALLASQALTHGHVDSVAYGIQGLQLDLGLAGTVSLFDVRQIM
ncbi:flagellar hook capping FlgD N-terminal domain-containing protein [Castellaniella sp.]|uniref:flagellar hook capping FlgD N-terminal domain-containing protein n=1 Tax=Castellaniella sp. TaxID=1955812 RepID=UPI0035648456